MKITFIGGGNMGGAMLSAILDKHLAIPGEITVSDVSEDRRKFLEKEYGVSTTADNRQAVKGSDLVIMAVKPQHLAGPMADLNGRLEDGQLVLSIIAGATIGTLSKGLDHGRLVRVMPNTPAQIGMGMSVWTATPEVTAEQKKMAGSILAASGKEIYVEDEQYLDMATAVSGSGPAYFFLFVEALVDAAKSIGFAPETAEELVLQTMLGSGQLIRESGRTPAELRIMVTSPGGTTAEALAEFERGNFKELVRKAVEAAYLKSQALGREQR